MTTLINYLKKHWHYIILSFTAIIFFIGTSSFNYYSQRDGFVKWFSPDETANYVFTKLYAETGELMIYEKYNPEAKEIIHPRSFRSDYGQLKPMSFLGMTLIYGNISKVFGIKVIPYLTPFFASLGIIFFYLLVKEIFGRTNALFSSLLLASFPVYVYYSVRSMFHNVLFTVLIIIALYFSVIMVKREQDRIALLFASLAGVFLGLAVITRTSELLWLAPAFFILWLLNIKRVGFIKLFLFIIFLFLAMVPAFYWNHKLYGSFWQGGYPQMNESLANITVAGSNLIATTAVGKVDQIKVILKQLKDSIFVFGLAPYQSLKMFYYYFARLFYWLFSLSALGFFLFLINYRKWKAKYFIYLSVYALISLTLLFYYGSWGFHDNPNPKSFTIGNSYTRYWLPIYLGAMPFASIFIASLTRAFKKSYLITAGRLIILSAIFFVSYKLVWAGAEEGLKVSYDKKLEMKEEYSKVISLTEPNSVIITQYHDKLFFPERKVIVGLFNDDNMNLEYARLTEKMPVYYYNFTLPKKDFNYLSQKFEKINLKLDEVQKIKEFSLYKFSLR